MSKQDEYRQFAADALDMAGKAAGIDSKTRLLNMADAWLNLADRADREPKRPRHPSREHPLVTKVLGREFGIVRLSWRPSKMTVGTRVPGRGDSCAPRPSLSALRIH